SATSDGSGNVMVTLTGVAEGTVTINATSEGVNQPSPNIRVLNPVASVTVSIAPADSIIGSGTATATATLRDAGNNILTGRPVAWNSSVAGTATVDAAGVITTGATPGQTIITATSEGVQGNRTFKYLAPANSISLTSSGDSVLGTGTLAISATVRDALNNILTGRAITWTSRTLAAATVSTSGVVTGVAPGTSWIVASVEGKLDSLNLRILPGINTIALTPATDSIIGTGSLALTATATDAVPTGIAGRPLAITSANTAVATVAPASGITNASGQVALTVTGVAPATSLLTVAAEGKTATRTIRVLAPVASVTLTAPGDSIIGTATLQVTATLRDGSSNLITGRPITWLSSNTSAATVSSTGLVTGVTPGISTNITATSEGVTSANYLVRVLAPVATVTVTAPDSSILVGQPITATAVTRDASSNILTGRPIAWTSSATGKATIGAGTGVITALDSGTTTITGTAEGQSGNFTLTIALVPAVTVTVTPASPNDSTGRQITFAATPRDSIGQALTGRVITWSSSNTSRLTINPSTGVATMVDSGTVNVIATTTPGTGGGGNATGQTTVTIVLTPINTVTAPAAHNTGAGSYNATAVDTRMGPAANRACTMSSSDTNFVTVPPNGTTNAAGVLVVTPTGVAVGSATVTVTCEGKTAQTVVTVP
ncbi:MAG: beta strand repeat-containing protein, partial [Gemmatimonadota bacterium]